MWSYRLLFFTANLMHGGPGDVSSQVMLDLMAAILEFDLEMLLDLGPPLPAGASPKGYAWTELLAGARALATEADAPPAVQAGPSRLDIKRQPPTFEGGTYIRRGIRSNLSQLRVAVVDDWKGAREFLAGVLLGEGRLLKVLRALHLMDPLDGESLLVLGACTLAPGKAYAAVAGAFAPATAVLADPEGETVDQRLAAKVGVGLQRSTGGWIGRGILRCLCVQHDGAEPLDGTQSCCHM